MGEDGAKRDEPKSIFGGASKGGAGGGESVAGLTKALEKLEKGGWKTYHVKGGDKAKVDDGAEEDSGLGEMWKDEGPRSKASAPFLGILSGTPKLWIEVDSILGDKLARHSVRDKRRGRLGHHHHATATQAAMNKRVNLREVRRELGAFTDKFVADEIQFDDLRQDVGSSVDRLIAARRFGEFGARKMQIAGMDFEGK